MSRLKKIKEAYELPFYILKRPFDGFYRLRHDNEAKIWVAIINIILLWFSISFMNQYASITVATPHPLAHNSLRDGLTVIIILLLWCVSNWSVTSLTDGEGRFKDIFLANCYAMTPLILFIVPATLFTNLLADTEAAFYFMILTIAIIWFIFLLFVGMVVVHNYTAVRALLTVFLTFIALLIIVFLSMLLIALLQQMLGFAFNIYTEMSFR